MERLTKKELRTLLEFIKECYPICDLETFAQRVVSRLAKIVPQKSSRITGSTRAGGGMLVRLAHNRYSQKNSASLFSQRALILIVFTCSSCACLSRDVDGEGIAGCKKCKTIVGYTAARTFLA